jgi:hypothetical protein
MGTNPLHIFREIGGLLGEGCGDIRRKIDVVGGCEETADKSRYKRIFHLHAGHNFFFCENLHHSTRLIRRCVDQDTAVI